MERLNQIVQIAREAGERILRVYQSDFAVQHKGDDSPLTEADLAAHRHIAAALRALTPELPLLSEEGADIAYATRKTWTRYWLVDPLDGTKEFVKRNGEFTVNIALIENHQPILGVVHAPALKLTYGAAQGFGAFQFTATGAQTIRTRKVPARAVLLGSRSHRDAIAPEQRLPLPPHDLLEKGSSLKFCMIAAGEADLHARGPGPQEWDSAAGQCLVEQAGGQVMQLPEWVPLSYNSKEDLSNPAMAVLGDAAFGWEQILRSPTRPF